MFDLKTLDLGYIAAPERHHRTNDNEQTEDVCEDRDDTIHGPKKVERPTLVKTFKDHFDGGEQQDNKAPEDSGMDWTSNLITQNLALSKSYDKGRLDALTKSVKSVVGLAHVEPGDQTHGTAGKDAEGCGKNNQKGNVLQFHAMGSQ